MATTEQKRARVIFWFALFSVGAAGFGAYEAYKNLQAVKGQAAPVIVDRELGY